MINKTGSSKIKYTFDDVASLDSQGIVLVTVNDRIYAVTELDEECEEYFICVDRDCEEYSFKFSDISNLELA